MSKLKQKTDGSVCGFFKSGSAKKPDPSGSGSETLEPEGEGECAHAVDRYMDQLEEVVRYSLPKGRSVAGFFAESIQAETGKQINSSRDWKIIPFTGECSDFSRQFVRS